MTFVALAIGAVAYALDVITKRLAAARLEEGRLYAGVGNWGARVVRTTRGSFTTLGPRVAVAVWATLVIAALLLQVDDGAVTIGMGLVLGGAFGNLVERARNGAVVDFVALGRWPVFNVADAAMVSGLALVLVGAR